MERIRKFTMERFNRLNAINRQTCNENNADYNERKLKKENEDLNRSNAKEKSAAFNNSDFVTDFKEEKFTFVWRIENVYRCNLKCEEFLESPVFSTKFCDEVKWVLRFYPRGSANTECDLHEFLHARCGCEIHSFSHSLRCGCDCENENTGIFIKRISTNPTNSSFKYRLSCEIHRSRSSGLVKTLVHPANGLASIKIDETNSTEYGTDDFYCFIDSPKMLVVKCDIYVTKVFNREFLGNQTADLLTSCTLFKDLKEMYETGRFSDVTLQARDVKIPAHKNILASRSKVFDVMFQHDMREAQTNVVQIEDVEPAVLISLLQYIYTGRVDDFTIEKAICLYSVADKYLLEELKNWCADMMLENITVENVCQLAVLADLYPDRKLKEATLSMFRNYASDIFKTEEWQNLLRNANYRVLVSEILSCISTDFITDCKDD